MRFCIPPIGEEFVLSRPWEFSLYYHRTNIGFIIMAGLEQFFTRIDGKTVSLEDDDEDFSHLYRGAKFKFDEVLEKITLPIGSRLSIYYFDIKCGRGNPEPDTIYNSVGLNLKKNSITTLTLGDGTTHPARFKGRTRFWVSIPDFNKIEII